MGPCGAPDLVFEKTDCWNGITHTRICFLILPDATGLRLCSGFRFRENNFSEIETHSKPAAYVACIQAVACVSCTHVVV